MERVGGRRPALATLGFAGLLALAPAGAIAQSESPAASGAADSVKVGFISPTTGWAAALGLDMQRGWDLFWEQNGSTVGGVDVETVYEDDTADPTVALTKAQRLVEEEGVQFVAGPIIASTAYAVADYVADAGIPTFQITGADDLTQRLADPLVLRAGYTSSQSNFPAGQWAYDQGHRNVVTICPDYPFGWESCGGFVKAFTDAGGSVTQVWHPLGTQDFGPYVTEVQAANPDAVFVGSAGGPDAILFWQAWTGFGLKDTIPLIGNCCFADQVLLRDQKEAASGITSFSYWTEGRDSDAVRAFVEAYEAKHNEIPSLYAAGSYLMAQLFATTLEQTGGVIDGPAFIEAASGITLDDSVYGPISFDDYNNIVGGVNREHTEDRGDGVFWNVVDETIPDVSQFWTYGAEAFLANPVFSRDYTGQAGAAPASPAPAESAEAAG